MKNPTVAQLKKLYPFLGLTVVAVRAHPETSFSTGRPLKKYNKKPEVKEL